MSNPRKERIDYLTRTIPRLYGDNQRLNVLVKKIDTLPDSKIIKLYTRVRNKAQEKLYTPPPPPPPRLERQRSYELPEAERFERRRDATEWLVKNMKISRKRLELMTDREVNKVYRKALRRKTEPKMREPTKKDLAQQVKAKEVQDRLEIERMEATRRRFNLNPSLRKQQRMLGSNVSRITGIPYQISRLIGEYASEPDIRLKVVPEGKGRKVRLGNAFRKIIEEGGGDVIGMGGGIDTLFEGRYVTEKGSRVTKASQLSDFVLKQIYDDYSDEELKLFIDPDMADDDPEFLELKAIREALKGKKTVIEAQKRVEQIEEEEQKKREDKEKETSQLKEAVRVSQMAEGGGGLIFEEEEEEEKEPTPLRAKDLFLPMTEKPVMTEEMKKTQKKINDAKTQTQYEMALLNKAIYSNNPQSVLNKSKRGNKFKIIDEDINYMVVEDDKGEVIVVVKGTDISDVKGQRKADLLQDLGILLNDDRMVTRISQIDNVVKKLQTKYGDNITVTGHSLGAYIANKVSLDNEIKGVVFNMGSSPFNRIRKGIGQLDNDLLTHYTTNVGTNIDPVSMTSARVDDFETIQVQPNQEIGSGVIKYHTIDHFLDPILLKNLNVGNNKDMDDLKNVLSAPDPEPEREQRDPLADNVARRINHNFSYLPNPLVPNRNESDVGGILDNNREMREDPDPLIEPNQPIEEQDRILEGSDARMPEGDAENPIGRIANRGIAGSNMSSMGQNYFMRQAHLLRRRQLRQLGDVGEEGFDMEEKEELEEKDEGIDVMDDTPFEGGMSNRQLLEETLKKLSYAKKGKWSGTDPKNSEDWRRIMKAKSKADDLLNSGAVNYLRDKEIPWKAPSRTYANSYVGLVRNSNKAMVNAMGELLP